MIFVLILLVKSLLGSCGNETCGTTQSACAEKSGCVWNDASVGECRKKKDFECVTLANADCAPGSGCEWTGTASCVRTRDPNCGVLVDGACAAGCTQSGTTSGCVANDKMCKALGDTYGQTYCTSALTFDAGCGALSSGKCAAPCKWESNTCKFDQSQYDTLCGTLGTSNCLNPAAGGVCTLQGGSCVFDVSYNPFPVPSCKWESNTCKFDSSKGSCTPNPSTGGCTEGSSGQCDSESKPICNALACQSDGGNSACTSASVQAGCEWKPSYCKPDSSSCGSSSGPCNTATDVGCVSTEASPASCSLVPNLDCASKTTQTVCEADGCKWTPEDKSLVIYAPLLLITLSLLMCL